MRLVRKGDEWQAHFTMIWEVEHLAELGDAWVPFALAGRTEPIGEIHAQTRAIKLYPHSVIADRQVVILLV